MEGRGRTVTAYGIAEIAATLEVSTTLVSTWRKRGKLPEPDITLRMGPVWFAATIEPWIKERQAEQALRPASLRTARLSHG